MISEALAHSPLKRFSHDEVAFTGDGIPRDAEGKPLDWVSTLQQEDDTTQAATLGESYIISTRGEYVTSLIKPSLEAPEPTQYILEPLFPRKALSLIAGDSGCGKSTYSAWLESQATLGKLTGKPLKVLVLATEDSQSELSALYNAYGANVENIRIFIKQRTLANGEMLLAPYDANDLPEIEKAALAFKPDLIRIDPLHRLCAGDWNAGRSASFLDDLNLLAQNLNAAIIGVMHTRKGANFAKEAITGTGQWVAKCRSAVVMACDENDENTAVVQHIKSNLSKKQNFEISFTSTPVLYSDGTHHDRRVVSTVTQTTRTVDELYAQNSADRAAFVDTDELGDLAKWVFETVKTRGGHMFAKDLFNMAKNNPSQWSTQQVRRSFRQINAATTKSLEFPPRSIVYLKSECSESEAQTWGSPANATE